MISGMLMKALAITNGYLVQHYSKNELKAIRCEIQELINERVDFIELIEERHSYEEVQDILSSLNEKETIRKNKGVYYTPSDIVEFILINSAKSVCGKLKPNNLHVMDLNGIPYSTFCYNKTVYDPTCGAGVFLLSALEMKLDLLDLHHAEVTKGRIRKVVSSIKGNDVNEESINITKLRLFLCVLHRHGVAKTKGIAGVINTCFTSFDFVTAKPENGQKYDIIIGNPPYVEDSKSDSIPERKYGNIYANVLENAALQLNPGGVLGFIVPLSYVATPRMKKIRDELYVHIPEQYILSYSDRPDCLFTSVHQKLCVLFGRNHGAEKNIYTGNYRYWYREERPELFTTTEIVRNHFVEEEFIPKLGTKLDAKVYEKLKKNTVSLLQILESGQEENHSLFLNMRAAFWIKAFLNEHTGAEYKEYHCGDENYVRFGMCLLNSSLFWWYWICVSDCWHITRKELNGFKLPGRQSFAETNRLAMLLEEQLEKTKRYVGTKQTEYEYKHKECVDVIHQIDDCINELYGLTEEESLYIKNFAYRYRISGGIKNECD